jgi:hypothetical protein
VHNRDTNVSVAPSLERTRTQIPAIRFTARFVKRVRAGATLLAPSFVPMRHLLSPRSFGKLVVLTVIVGGAAAWGECGSSSDLATANGGGGTNYATAVAASGSGGTIIHDDAVGTGGGSSSAKPLCGGGCTPGTGTAEPCSLDPSSNGGAGGTGGSGGADVPSGACQLAVNGEALEGVCGVPGTAQDGEPCLSVLDCAAGFGCVQPGVCRAYCCGDAEACPAKSYCAMTPIAVDGPAPSGDAPMLPVCAPAEPCTLLDDGSCADAARTCTIVRADGTTSCVTPGNGKDGEGCPCAAGFVCSFGQNTCLRLCHTNREDDCPSGHQCSGGSKWYPAGFGVCVSL